MQLATAIVVARANSQRLPNKALLPFAGTTLIGHKVRTLLRCKLVGRVVVGSDSRAILDEAARHGAATVERDAYHCDESKCSANEMIRDMVERVPGGDGETYLWAHPTNPLVTAGTYDRAICVFEMGWRYGKCDSLASLRAERRHAWYRDVPLNHSPRFLPHKPASELSPVLYQDGAIFIQTRKRFLETSYFYGLNPDRFVIPWQEGWDVDTAEELTVARALWEARHPCESQSLVVGDRYVATAGAMPSTWLLA
jgi:CMP-N-acetylneuraminic acid synthetase